jgi:hypothetical protein
MANKKEKKVCFVISPIGDEDSDTRKRSDQVLKHIITGPVESLGYEVIRADKISEPGIITSQIIEFIVDAALVVADLTERNPNVFYELALRHATRKPLVQLIKKGELIPFDVAATRIINFDLHNLDSVEAAKEELSAQVTSLESGKNDTDNPVSVSLDLKMLKESGDPEERSLADIVEAISDLRLTVTSLDKGLHSKLFKDFQTMIEELSGKINRIDPDYRRGRRALHPMMLEELLHLFEHIGDPIGIVLAAGLIRDDSPWFYEIAMEAYRAIKSRKPALIKAELNRIRKLSESKAIMLISDEFGYRNIETNLMTREFPRFLEHVLSFAAERVAPKRAPGRKKSFRVTKSTTLVES